MALNLSEAKKNDRPDYGRIDEGTYPARVVQIIDIGLQVEDYKGEVKEKNKVFVTFEFPTETITIDDEEKPRWLSKEFVVSFHEKSALTALINAVPKELEYLSDLIGEAVMVGVGTTSSGKAKVTSVAKLMKGVNIPGLQNKSVAFDFDEPDMDVFHSLPEFLQTKIKEAKNFEGSEVERLLGSVKDNKEDEVPFDEE